MHVHIFGCIHVFIHRYLRIHLLMCGYTCGRCASICRWREKDTCVFICGCIRIYMCLYLWLYTNILVSLSVIVYEYTCVCICCIRIYMTCRHVWIRAHIYITRIHLCVCEISFTWIGRFIIGRTREVGGWGRVQFSRI